MNQQVQKNEKIDRIFELGEKFDEMTQNGVQSRKDEFY